MVWFTSMEKKRGRPASKIKRVPYNFRLKETSLKGLKREARKLRRGIGALIEQYIDLGLTNNKIKL